MARITIEDCMEKVPNRFQLVQMAAIRAKQLKRGAAALLDKDDNKEVVTALREIAAGIVTPDMSEVPDVDPLFVAAPSTPEPLSPDSSSTAATTPEPTAATTEAAAPKAALEPVPES